MAGRLLLAFVVYAMPAMGLAQETSAGADVDGQAEYRRFTGESPADRWTRPVDMYLRRTADGNRRGGLT